MCMLHVSENGSRSFGTPGSLKHQLIIPTYCFSQPKTENEETSVDTSEESVG